MSKRNPVAKALRSPHLKTKVVKSKKAYNRKKEKKNELGSRGKA